MLGSSKSSFTICTENTLLVQAIWGVHQNYLSRKGMLRAWIFSPRIRQSTHLALYSAGFIQCRTVVNHLLSKKKNIVKYTNCKGLVSIYHAADSWIWIWFCLNLNLMFFSTVYFPAYWKSKPITANNLCFLSFAMIKTLNKSNFREKQLF